MVTREPRPSGASQRRRPAASGLWNAIWTVVCGWSPLLAGGFLVQLGGRAEVAVFAAFLVGTLLAAAVRPRRSRRRRGASAVLLGMGLVAGFATFPAWVRLMAWAGLSPAPTPGALVPQVEDSPWVWITLVGLAPVFEELLYRERLLATLEGRLRAVPALALSSAAFALPRLEPWTVLATFLVGLALGAVMLRTGAVALCIGLHAGLNLGALFLGVEPAALELPVWVLAAAGGIALMAGIGLSESPHPPSRAPSGGGASSRRPSPPADPRAPETRPRYRATWRTFTPASRSSESDTSPSG